MKFIELDSSEWGKIKTADIGIAGIALTFIDDFKGRDMPLLRGKLDGIDVRLEQGTWHRTKGSGYSTSRCSGARCERR